MSVSSAEAEVLDLHDRFCEGFAARRPDLVLETVADTPELVVVTSEESVLRGTDELRAFLARYVNGPTTYSWTWDDRDALIANAWAGVLAIGTEVATGDAGEQRTPYRMTLVAERRGERWTLVQVHGSSPHS